MQCQFKYALFLPFLQSDNCFFLELKSPSKSLSSLCQDEMTEGKAKGRCMCLNSILEFNKSVDI